MSEKAMPLKKIDSFHEKASRDYVPTSLWSGEFISSPVESVTPQSEVVAKSEVCLPGDPGSAHRAAHVLSGLEGKHFKVYSVIKAVGKIEKVLTWNEDIESAERFLRCLKQLKSSQSLKIVKNQEFNDDEVTYKIVKTN